LPFKLAAAPQSPFEVDSRPAEIRYLGDDGDAAGPAILRRRRCPRLGIVQRLPQFDLMHARDIEYRHASRRSRPCHGGHDARGWGFKSRLQTASERKTHLPPASLRENMTGTLRRGRIRPP